MINKIYRGRIAPTTSGLLHIGHARTFAIAHKRARQNYGKIILRIEDIDTARCTKQYETEALIDLKSIGLDWDEGIDIGGKFAPYRQSQRFDFYWSIIKKLSAQNFIYPCNISRAKLKAEGFMPKQKYDFCQPDAIFPPNLRSNCENIDNIENPKSINWRFKVPENKKITFIDNNFGEISFATNVDFGDFLVWRKSNEPSYELAVVADDIDMQITEIVRGADLLLSTARQILIYQALNAQIPEFYHCELLKNDNGEKISKSSMDKSADNKWLIKSLKQA